ncbi:Spy/CpxP family protein refolding chaperone [Xanthobacter sp. V3C-3]|uniref:Spy/CpxP family protein refolding chaperone n=1 Tax=Xanthobacter lutulentifluminis TaxID=3119935 RepID=UPI0037271A3F
MKRAVIAATAAALIAGSAATFAANPGTGAGPGNGPGAERAARWQPSAEDRAILTDARIAALKTALKLTPDQEKLWPGVETALKDVAKDRAARRDQARAAREAARQASTAPDPIARMRAMATRMDAGAADLRKIADAADPLYKTLDDAQKHRLNALLHQQFRGMHGPKGPHGDGPRRG